MRTIQQRDAGIHNWGMIILITFFSTVWFAVDAEALPHLLYVLKGQWMQVEQWFSSFHAAPHRTQWP